MKSKWIILLMLAAAMPAIAGQMYSWVDDKGVKHFSDSPPPASVKNATKLTLHGGVTSDNAQEQHEAAAEAAKPVETAANQPLVDSAETRANACKQAKDNLELLQGERPISMAGADGKPQVLDDDQRKQEVARAQEQVSFYCR